MKKIVILFLLVVSTLFAEVKTHLKHTKVTKDEKGNIEKVEPNSVSPGDILEYTFTIDNLEPESIKNLSPTIPVPNGATLIPETGNPSNYLVSINGRDFYPYPIKVDGVPVQDSEYKGVSWNIEELKPEEKVELQVQVKVNGGE